MADEKKIIIDEDWKAQVQAEKEAAAHTAPTEPADAADHGRTQPGPGPLPPASLEMLVTMLATEALAALGQIPHPATGQLQVEPGQAQYLIDLIDVIHQKTTGNLTPTEQQMIEAVLHQLRLAYVESIGAASTGPPVDHLA